MALSAAMALACALAREPIVSATLAAPVTSVVVKPATTGGYPDEKSCSATDKNQMTVVVGITPHGSLSSRAAAAKKLGLWSDDGAPVANLGDGAVNSYIQGVSVQNGTTLLRVAVYPGGETRRKLMDAEGILTANPMESARIARALLPKVPRSL